MSELYVASPTSPTLETLQNRSRDVRRVRPPDITVLRNENRVPLRPERLAKRESRIGLRNIFGKSKTGKDDKATEEASSLRVPSRNAGKRTSLADLSAWPQRLHTSRSEISLLSSPPASVRSPVAETASRTWQNGSYDNKGKLRQPAPSKSRGPTTTFDPPPLFKMYPQAVKHATLPACITSIDSLVRLNDSKTSLQQSDFSQSDLTLDQRDASDKKKRSKNSPEWTTKIYSLVTSGYLLQYAAEGSFNRLPEKVLQLTRDSAAYVSDIIPGRHWVIRVASSTDADGNPSADTKSFRSKLALRGIEKRQVSNMLLVFESPEMMDMWLAILRREIESLGGKKKLSETGKLEAEEGTTMLRAQASQRTLVVRDPDRFSRIITQDFSWNEGNALVDPNENDFNNPPPERMSQSTVDDDSSMLSSEGQRLDSLRNSGSGSSGSSGSSGNRLSFVSSGQRTILSSAESSPATSPICESFSSLGDDYRFHKAQPPLPPTPEVRPRPNAAAIVNRRQSMQTMPMIPGFDPRLDIGGRPASNLPSNLATVHEKKHQFVPNFSVPHTVGRRYSTMNLSTPTPHVDQPQIVNRDGPIRQLRRSPPTTLAISRPLSIVLDQPSPRSPYSPTVPAKKNSTLQAPDSPSIFGPWAGHTPRPQERPEASRSLTSTPIIGRPQPRRSATSIGHHGSNTHASQQDSARPNVETDNSYVIQPAQAQPAEPVGMPEHILRTTSPLEMRRASTAPPLRHPPNKRSTMLAEKPVHQNRHSLIYPKQSILSSIEEPAYTLAPPQTCSPKRSAPSLKALQQETSSKQFLAIDIGAKSLATRRSMPLLADGPPPAPPPTCALPPLPRKRSMSKARGIEI